MKLIINLRKWIDDIVAGCVIRSTLRKPHTVSIVQKKKG